VAASTDGEGRNEEIEYAVSLVVVRVTVVSARVELDGSSGAGSALP